MSVFTMSLQEVIDLHGENNIGLDTYPVISPTHRERINKAIRDQYLNREIAHESVSIWRHRMRTKMNQIMPVYNKLFESETLVIDPMRTIDLRTISESDRNTSASSSGESEATADNTTTSRNVNSDTPQVFLNEMGNYASAAADGRADATGKNTGKEKAESDSEEKTSNESTTQGYQGNPSELLMAYRSTILNIDMMIVDELEPLFYGLLLSGDSFFTRKRII